MERPLISIGNDLKVKCPDLQLGCMLVRVTVDSSPLALLELIQQEMTAIQAALTIDKIHGNQPLAETRSAYKALGKDPSRYRPSAEALLRRVVQGKGLYQVNNAVDALNLVSVRSGFSIGGYDFDKIDGSIIVGIGEENEPYEAIGRGVLNIRNLPVLRDQTGAFGSPTSDSTRTMMTGNATTFLVVFFNFQKNEKVEVAMNDLGKWLEKFAEGEISKQWVVG